MASFAIKYLVTIAEEENIGDKIDRICLEQSVELPRTVIPEEVEMNVVGQPVSRKQINDHLFEVVISWPLDNVGDEISQFINILYGNISLQPGIRVIGAEWNKLQGDLFGGPAFGLKGIRSRMGISGRALCSTALKPVGSSTENIAGICFEFAAGGMDIIKDDHGLANQAAAPFTERVKACVESVRRAREETGSKACYFPNITALSSVAKERYLEAAEMGADGVLMCPHITGLETMHQLSRMDVPLPIIAHPAFSGSLTTVKTKGLTPVFLYGQLWRALGADFIIYPNVDGRFSFSAEECISINDAILSDDLPFEAAFPMPGGGIDRNTIAHWLETYGNDTVFLVGGSLYEHSEGPRAASQEFLALLK